MNYYCQSTNLDIFPLVNIDLFDKVKNSSHCSLDIWDDINPDVIALLRARGIKLQYAEAFFRLPNSEPHIHSDEGPGDYVKLNWIFGGKDSIMQWFMVKPEIEKQVRYNKVGTVEYVYTINEVELAYEENIKNPSIVQVGSPHNIINPFEDRICISLVLRDFNNNRLTMQDAQTALAKYII
jgi:hypothetical protein